MVEIRRNDFGAPGSGWSSLRTARWPKSHLARWCPHPQPTMSTTMLGYLPCLASCSRLAAVAQYVSFFFLKATSKKRCWCLRMSVPFLKALLERSCYRASAPSASLLGVARCCAKPNCASCYSSLQFVQ